MKSLRESSEGGMRAVSSSREKSASARAFEVESYPIRMVSR